MTYLLLVFAVVVIMLEWFDAVAVVVVIAVPVVVEWSVWVLLVVVVEALV